ncbi:MAG: TolC family outer membrane protein [Steroidobacteraceae bacterium]|jgi:outer membrane protein|nr:TolC family outer membrane protein [Steroidobacteraceae bacterium]
MKPTRSASFVVRATLTGLLAASPPGLAAAADLAEVYQRALRNDPQLREAEALRLAAREARPQALASLLPQLSASGGYEQSENDGNRLEFDATGNAAPFASASDLDVRTWQVQLRQTIFRWDQFATFRRAGVEVAQAEVDFRAAQQDVILRTAQAYFNVLAARDTLDAAEAAAEAISRQLEQAEKRFEVGLIAITDVQEAKAAADQANATVIGAKRALATAREQLRELTGDAFDELEKPGDDMPLVSPDPASEDDWVKAALDQNLRLQSSRLAAEIARENIAVARGGHLPTLDLVVGRSSFEQDGDSTTPRGTFTTDTSNDEDSIGIQVTVPIYSGGATSSRVREAVYRQRAARERLERTARETERRTRDAYLGVLSEISRVQSLRQALESSRTALAATEAGYEVGTRTAVDVLDARRRLFQAQTDYARSRYDYVLNVLALEQAAGTLDEARLTRVNGWLSDAVPVR